MDPELREFLLALRARDDAKRSELVGRGELYLGYHPEMEQVHVENAGALRLRLAERGWPLEEEVRADGAEAAFIVALHAISQPAFQRLCLALLDDAVRNGGAPAAQRALLTDRIRYNERRPQVFGTILDWDAEGLLSPWPVEAPAELETRRRAAGLPPLDISVEQARERTRSEGGRAPKPYAQRQAEILEWARRCGWVAE